MYFLAICVNFSCKIEKFELEVVVVDIFGTRFCFQRVAILTNLTGKLQLKKKHHYFFIFNKFQNYFTLVNNNIDRKGYNKNNICFITADQTEHSYAFVCNLYKRKKTG